MARRDQSHSSTKPTTGRVPRRRRGGQAVPDHVQDRSEQSEGHDRAAQGGHAREDVERRSVLADVIPEDAGEDSETSRVSKH